MSRLAVLLRLAASPRLAMLAGAVSAASWAAPAGAVELLGGPETPLAMEVGNGQLLRLDQAATSVFVADPEVADVQVVSPRLIYIFARQAGTTNLMAVTGDDRVIANVALSVQQNLDQARDAIAAIAPGASTFPVGRDRVLITGDVDTPVEAADVEALAGAFVSAPENVINRTQVLGPTQVNLRVRFAEVSRSASEALGINWESVLGAGDFAFSLATGRDFVDLASTARTISRSDDDGIGGGFRNEDLDFNLLIDALEEQNLLTILAEPNLTALSGQEASFLAGGEFPIPVATDENTISVEFREFGVSLAFRPTVLTGNRISLRVRPEVSQLSEAGAVEVNGISIPALTTRRADTTVELGSGQSFVIAGLFQASQNRDASQLPFLGDVPILGRLFQSTRFQRAETELVIVVTPYLVGPVSDPNIALPVDVMGAPAETLPAAGAIQTSAASVVGARPGFTGFILK